MIVWGGDRNGGGRYDPATDNWTPLSRLYEAEDSPAAIWTGTEMIVWGASNYSSDTSNAGNRYNPSSDSWQDVSTTGAPGGRFKHTTIWTGSKMIVWGGAVETYNGAETNTGGIYDPVLDSWVGITLTEAPGPRISHSAIWTGTEMIIWGGTYLDGDWDLYLNDGGRYDPADNSWSPMNTTNAPVGRERFTAIWSGSEMIVWGGLNEIDHEPSYLATGGRYNPETDSWVTTNMTNAPEGRRNHTSVWTGEEMIVWDGFDDKVQSHYNSGGRYDPSSNTWIDTDTTGAPSGRQTHTAVWTGTEMIVWGGYDGSSDVDTGGRYDPATDSWTATYISDASIPMGRSGHTTVWTGNEMIIWGGSDGSSTFNSGGWYDPATNVWQPTSTTNAPTARNLHTAVWTGSEMVIWGGGGGTVFLNTGGRYTPANDSWLPTSVTEGAPDGRYDHTAVWTGSKMIVWGGYKFEHIINTGAIYDPSNDSWTPTNTTGAPDPVWYRTAVWSGEEMIVWGGYRFDGNDATDDYYNTGGRYNPENNSWQATSLTNAPSGREYPSAIWNGSEMIIWGGKDSNALNGRNTGGRYDPASDTWTTTTTEGAPGARYRHSVVWTGTEMIIWGGLDDDPSTTGTGGRYNPVMDSWEPTATVGAPVKNYQHTAIWTGSEMILWGSGHPYPNDTNIYYPYSSHMVGGSVTGLSVNDSIVLQNNTGDDLLLTVDGSFTFATALISGSTYNVTVLSQPTTPNLYCGVPEGNGTISGANVTNVDVNCVTLSLKNSIAALQVLVGLDPAETDLAPLPEIAAGGKITLAEVITVLRELSGP